MIPRKQNGVSPKGMISHFCSPNAGRNTGILMFASFKKRIVDLLRLVCYIIHSTCLVSFALAKHRLRVSLSAFCVHFYAKGTFFILPYQVYKPNIRQQILSCEGACWLLLYSAVPAKKRKEQKQCYPATTITHEPSTPTRLCSAITKR